MKKQTAAFFSYCVLVHGTKILLPVLLGNQACSSPAQGEFQSEEAQLCQGADVLRFSAPLSTSRVSVLPRRRFLWTRVQRGTGRGSCGQPRSAVCTLYGAAADTPEVGRAAETPPPSPENGAAWQFFQHCFNS